MVDYPIQYDAADINLRLDQVLRVNDKFGMYCGTAPINFDFTNSQIIIPKGHIIYDGKYYTSTAYPSENVVSITNTDDGISALWFDISTLTYIVAHYSTWASYESNINLITIATFRVNQRVVFGASGPYKVDGEYPADTKHYDKLAIFCGTDYINFDFTNSQIIIPEGYLVYNGSYLSPVDGDISKTIPITNTADGLQGLYYDTVNRVFVASHYSELGTKGILNNPSYLGIATFWYEYQTAYGQSGPFKINGLLPRNGGVFYDKNAVFSGRDYINFDFANSQIIIPPGVVIYNNWYSFPVAYPNSITLVISDMSDGVQGLFYNTTTREFVSSKYTNWVTLGLSNNPNFVLIATYWIRSDAQTAYGPSGPFKINGELIGVENYNSTTDRLILPDKMYFLTGELLPVYKSSIVASTGNLDYFKTALVLQPSDRSPTYDYFYENVDIDPSTLPSSFKIGVNQTTNSSKNYYKSINTVITDPVTKTSSAPSILCIGDSLTNRNIPALLKSKLGTLNINSTMIGTMENQGGERGEGREGWEFQNFIGSDNLHGTTQITRLENGDTSTLYQNPFLKLATPDDLISRPAWCFRNTGVTNELSYVTDPDKTGNFYIFDFAWYLSNHSVATPSIVTIALSTNDILQETAETSLANARLGLSIMVQQIHTACPSAKIGIIPSPAWGNTTSGNTIWVEEVVPWIENCITDVNTLNIGEVSIVPVWCHMDRTWNWPYSSTTALSSINSEVVATRSEYVHFGDSGKYQYIDALAAYIVSAL